MGVETQDVRIDKAMVKKIQDLEFRKLKLEEFVKRAEDHKEDVIPAVYHKVLADYQARLLAIAMKSNTASEESIEALKTIQTKEAALHTRIAAEAIRLEEARFRFQVGELHDDDLKQQKMEIKDKIEKLDAHLSIIVAQYDEFKQQTPQSPPAPEKRDLLSETAVNLRPHESGEIMQRKIVSHADESAIREKAPLDIPSGASVHMHAADGSSEFYPVTDQPLLIGRHPDNQIVLRKRTISRKHARISKGPDDSYQIVDTSSGGGLSVNGLKTRSAELKDQDVITIEDFRMIFYLRK